MTTYKTGGKGIELIKHFESLHDGDLTRIGLQPKMCPAGIWTEGYGHAMIHEGKFLRGKENKDLAYSLSKIHTVEDAERTLKTDLPIFENSLNAMNLSIDQNQFDALVSFCFNEGFGAFKGSTLLRRIRVKASGIREAFLVWNKADTNADGKLEVLPGLTLRREAEAKLYLS